MQKDNSDLIKLLKLDDEAFARAITGSWYKNKEFVRFQSNIFADVTRTLTEKNQIKGYKERSELYSLLADRLEELGY